MCQVDINLASIPSSHLCNVSDAYFPFRLPSHISSWSFGVPWQLLSFICLDQWFPNSSKACQEIAGPLPGRAWVGEARSQKASPCWSSWRTLVTLGSLRTPFLYRGNGEQFDHPLETLLQHHFFPIILSLSFSSPFPSVSYPMETPLTLVLGTSQI